MATNSYGSPCTPNLGGIKDYYTKAEVNKLLNAKTNTSNVYTRLYLDDKFLSIENSLSSLTSLKIDQGDLDSALQSLRTSIETQASNTYATLTNTYTKSEVYEIFSSLDVNPADYIRTVPTTTAQNTINPGSNNVTALTVRGSSTNPVVLRILDSSSDVIGYIGNDGSTTLEGVLNVGRLVSDGTPAIYANHKRIYGVANPIHPSDAIPFKFLQEYARELYEDVLRPTSEAYYYLDAEEY